MYEHLKPAPQIPLSVDQLNTAEKLVLWSFRVWVRGNSSQIALQQTLKDGFDIANVPDAFLKFDEMMSVTQSLLKISVEVRCVKCRSVNPDELTLLSAISGLQHNKFDHFTASMSHWIPNEYISEIIPPCLEFAGLMANEKLILRRWEIVTKPKPATFLENFDRAGSTFH